MGATTRSSAKKTPSKEAKNERRKSTEKAGKKSTKTPTTTTAVTEKRNVKSRSEWVCFEALRNNLIAPRASTSKTTDDSAKKAPKSSSRKTETKSPKESNKSPKSATPKRRQSASPAKSAKVTPTRKVQASSDKKPKTDSPRKSAEKKSKSDSLEKTTEQKTKSNSTQKQSSKRQRTSSANKKDTDDIVPVERELSPLSKRFIDEAQPNCHPLSISKACNDAHAIISQMCTFFRSQICKTTTKRNACDWRIDWRCYYAQSAKVFFVIRSFDFCRHSHSNGDSAKVRIGDKMQSLDETTPKGANVSILLTTALHSGDKEQLSVSKERLSLKENPFRSCCYVTAATVNSFDALLTRYKPISYYRCSSNSNND